MCILIQKCILYKNTFFAKSFLSLLSFCDPKNRSMRITNGNLKWVFMKTFIKGQQKLNIMLVLCFVYNRALHCPFSKVCFYQLVAKCLVFRSFDILFCGKLSLNYLHQLDSSLETIINLSGFQTFILFLSHQSIFVLSSLFDLSFILVMFLVSKLYTMILFILH